MKKKSIIMFSTIVFVLTGCGNKEMGLGNYEYNYAEVE